jgi:energy-coupling factor transport system ATP-binding protein
MTAIAWSQVRFAHPDGRTALDGIDLELAEGDLVLVLGASGSGKSTLCRTVNGLVPHTSGGRFGGRVTVMGRDTTTHRPRDLADVVGFVHQDPEAQFVIDHVEADLAFVLENLGTAPDAMRRRIEESLDALGIAHLRDRSPSSLSGGERQRAAIAGALAAVPSVLVLDEPTSELDPQGADDVLAAVDRLRDDLGTTVVLAEHRLERAGPLADHAVVLEAGVITARGSVREVLPGYAGAAPVTRLGHLLGWEPTPLTVREARRLARTTEPLTPLSRSDAAAPGEVLVAARHLSLGHGRMPLLDDIDLEVGRGEVVALLGRNGSGKTTLLRAMAGLHEPSRGELSVSASVGYVPQDPNALLFATTVEDELAETLRLRGRPDGDRVDEWLERLGLTALRDRHPRSLSAGQRQRVAVAAVAVGGADVLLLDEPTRGIDPPSAAALETALRDHRVAGRAAVMATHDVELAARVATRVIVLGDGDIVADGPAPEVLAGSLFAPQVLRVLPSFLTVDEVAAARARTGAGP